MLQTNQLQFAYPSGPLFTFPNVTVSLQEVLLVLGKSGSGKTTLLHLLAGLMKPTNGTVTVDNTTLTALGHSALDAFRGKHIGLVFQQPLFIRSVSVMHNLQLARTLAGLPADADRAMLLLSELGIADKATQLPQSLSIGERQRASIARALMAAPSLVLADEPTSALDDTNCQRVAELLHTTATRHNAALVIVTHDRRLKERFANTVEL